MIGSREKYRKYASGRAKKSSVFTDCLNAFVFGGLICTFGQGLRNIYISLGASGETAGTLVAVSLIFISALLTGSGVFDDIARHAGAGTLVPITGFANAVAAPAIDNKAEGYILGLGTKIFVIAGPVVLYGTAAGTVYGVIYYLAGLASRCIGGM